ncbi:VWA domain-containing protein [Candidatus Woesebacteria bacterium]|nr:MAG: VWA domain-containing protein [Candidatus Woesebacteria bacterium]
MKSISRKNINQSGAVILLYVLIIAIIAALLLAVAQSRLLLALRRTKSASDSLVSTYQAESIANDYLARFIGGYLDKDDMPFNESFEIGSSRIVASGNQLENVQTFLVTSELGYSASKVRAERTIYSLGNVEKIDIILSLDCTGSMDAGASCPNCFTRPTRFDAQKEAAINFVNNIKDLENSNKFNIGINVFGIDAKWLVSSRGDVSPDAGYTFDEIISALNDGFGSTRQESPACQSVMDSTSVGSAYDMSHKYFADDNTGTKQIEIVITDGIPNSRVPSSGCPLSVFCPAFPIDTINNNYCDTNEYGWQCYLYEQYKDGPWDATNFNAVAYSICEPLGKDYLKCALADKETYIPGLGIYGQRKPETDAYSVTIFNNPPKDVINIFRNYSTNYFNASQADQLPSILSEVLEDIVSERSIVTLHREIPE